MSETLLLSFTFGRIDIYLLDTFLEVYDPTNQAYDLLTGQKLVQEMLCADTRESGKKVIHKPTVFFNLGPVEGNAGFH